jgi:hypothetical protein
MNLKMIVRAHEARTAIGRCSPGDRVARGSRSLSLSLRAERYACRRVRGDGVFSFIWDLITYVCSYLSGGLQ